MTKGGAVNPAKRKYSTHNNLPKMKNQKNSLTTKEYLIPFILITSLFFLWGFARAILDVMNKHFQNELNITITHSAMVQVTTYVGYFLMAIPAGWFINRQGYRLGVILGLMLFAIGALMFIPGALAGEFYIYLAALFIIGCGLVFLETSANPYATELGDRSTATSRLNFSQSFNGLGGLCATFFVGRFLFREEANSNDVVFPYAILAFVVIVIAVIFTRVNLPEIKIEKKDDKINVVIGSESSVKVMNHSSIVFKPITTKDGRTLGAIGVIGPLRMDYAKVLATIAGVSGRLADLLNDTALPESKDNEGDIKDGQ